MEVEAVVGGFVFFDEAGELLYDILTSSSVPEALDFSSKWRVLRSVVEDGVCLMKLMGSGFASGPPGQVEESLGWKSLGGVLASLLKPVVYLLNKEN